ncbi:LysR family transcriptional regulator [Cobetia sp. cqz5-12]|nr:LysR family transcriptional regulator [Cobetia sp. cqz5-12]
MSLNMSTPQNVSKNLSTKLRLGALPAFDAAARHLNFRRAAQELSLTQSAVAQRVRELETQLGVKLFHRLPRGLALTPAGQRFHEQIVLALGNIDKAVRDASHDPADTTLSLSVPPSFAAKWLMPRLASFRHAHPEWQLRVHASEGLSNLHQDGIDLAIRQGYGQHDAGLKAIWLTGLERIAVCSPGYREQLGERLDRLDMRGCVLIEDSHQGWHTFAAHFSGLEKADRLWVNHTSLAIDAALADQGVALTPRLMATEGIAKGKLVTLCGLPDQGQGFYLVYPGARAHQAEQIMLPWLRQQLGLSHET